MAKVLIIGPNYFNFLPATESAFSRLGWEVSVMAYDNPIHPYTSWMKWKYKLSRHRDRMQAKSRAAFADTVLTAFRAVRPELVFILNGDINTEVALSIGDDCETVVIRSGTGQYDGLRLVAVCGLAE